MNGHKVTFHAELNAGVPLEYVASRYHRVNVDKAGDRYAIELSDTDIPMDHDLELSWKPVPDRVPRAMMFTESIGRNPHVLLMMLPPDDLSVSQQPMLRDLIFVIDTSGSAGKEGADSGVRRSQVRRSVQCNSIQYRNEHIVWR
jgi:Ca-activated chloride channel family protein